MCSRKFVSGTREGIAYPDVEIEVLVCYRLYVETYRGDCSHYLADLESREWWSARHVESVRVVSGVHLESVEQCRLSGVILHRWPSISKCTS